MTQNVDINPTRNASAAQLERRDLIASIALITVVAAWGLAVAILAHSGALLRLYQPLIAAIVAATIIIPTTIYFQSPTMRRLAEKIGHRRIVMFHVWRIPAALLFFWYGAQGMLPPLFWILAGVGDLIAGLYALRISLRGEDPHAYRAFHRLGFADFVVAVGTGLTFTLLMDPRMAPIATIPLAFVPLFGVGISGASHLIAFDMLHRGVGHGRLRADMVAT